MDPSYPSSSARADGFAESLSAASTASSSTPPRGDSDAGSSGAEHIAVSIEMVPRTPSPRPAAESDILPPMARVGGLVHRNGAGVGGVGSPDPNALGMLRERSTPYDFSQPMPSTGGIANPSNLNSPAPGIPARPASPGVAAAPAAPPKQHWFTQALDYLFRLTGEAQVIAPTNKWGGCNQFLANLRNNYFALALLVSVSIVLPLTLATGVFHLTPRHENEDDVNSLCGTENVILQEGAMGDCFTAISLNYPLHMLFVLYAGIYLYQYPLRWRSMYLLVPQCDLRSVLYVAKMVVVILEICILDKTNGEFPRFQIGNICLRSCAYVSYMALMSSDFVARRKHPSFVRVWALVSCFSRYQRIPAYHINGQTNATFVVGCVLNSLQIAFLAPVKVLRRLESDAEHVDATSTSFLWRDIPLRLWGIMSFRIVVSITDGVCYVFAVRSIGNFIAGAGKRTSIAEVTQDLLPYMFLMFSSLICRAVAKYLGTIIVCSVGRRWKIKLYQRYMEGIRADFHTYAEADAPGHAAGHPAVDPMKVPEPGFLKTPVSPANPAMLHWNNQRQWFINTTFKHSMIVLEFWNLLATLFAPVTQILVSLVLLVALSVGFATLLTSAMMLVAIYGFFRWRLSERASLRVCMINDIEPYGVGIDLYPLGIAGLSLDEPTETATARAFDYYLRVQNRHIRRLALKILSLDLVEWLYLFGALTTWIIFGHGFALPQENGFKISEFTVFVLLVRQIYDAIGAILAVMQRWTIVKPSMESMKAGLRSKFFTLEKRKEMNVADAYDDSAARRGSIQV